MGFIDVGANVGDTIPLLRGLAHFPILAIEGDTKFFEIMKLNIASEPDVVPKKIFLGESKRGGLTFEEINGTGHLVANESGETCTLPLDDVLAEHKEFGNAKMIKIDTDGFDAHVLRGAMGYLRRTKPVLFFEYAPHYWQQQGEDCLSIFPWLKDLGYEHVMVFLPSGDFLFSASLERHEFFEELRVMHKRLHFYGDICAFSKEDGDLFLMARKGEMKALLEQSRW